ncbi:MAG: pilus assembly protein PilM [Clostridium sp.]
MFEKDVVAIDITKAYISILVGHKYNISNGVILETPKGSYENDKIQDVDAIAGVIKGFLHKNKGKAKEVSFVLRGQDLITRHMYLPIMKEEALRDSIDFELRQFVGDRVDELYFDYEVISANKEENNGASHVLVVAVEKEKVDNYMDLASKLNMKVKSIDAYANVAARLIRNLKQSAKTAAKSIGVIDLEGDSNSISIIEWDRLMIERYNSVGALIGSDKMINNVTEYNSMLDTVDLIEAKEFPTTMDRTFESIMSGYNSIIQYYATGKVKKNLDRIFVMGSATRIKGIQQYVEVSLNTKVNNTPTFKDLKNSVKAPTKIELNNYMYPYGLLLRKE